jgi:hypothetical protein
LLVLGLLSMLLRDHMSRLPGSSSSCSLHALTCLRVVLGLLVQPSLRLCLHLLQLQADLLLLQAQLLLLEVQLLLPELQQLQVEGARNSTRLLLCMCMGTCSTWLLQRDKHTAVLRLVLHKQRLAAWHGKQHEWRLLALLLLLLLLEGEQHRQR